MIETPTATAIVQTSPQEPEYSDTPLTDPDNKHPLEEEVLLVKQKPITSKIRTTLRHLRNRAGFWSRFRGAHIAFFKAVLFHASSGVISSIFPRSLFFKSFTYIIVSILLARISMVWTHHVISEPSEKCWLKRVAPRSAFKKIAGPTAIVAVAEQSTLLIPALMSKHFKLKEFVMSNGQNRGDPTTVLFASGGILMITFILMVFVLLPLHVALTRVYGSLLAEEEESIVPFDRTYGGKVVPEIVGGSGKLEMRDAWKSFDWNARVRLVKIYLKTFAMQFALTILFIAVMFMNVRLIMGKQLDDMVKAVVKGHKELKI